jgi:hypothetical protein
VPAGTIGGSGRGTGTDTRGMDPVSLQASGLNALRPTIALSNDVGAVLREGRVLAGEVLQSFGGGSLLIGIGPHRVPAESQVELRPGQRFLFQVEGSGEALTLRVLEEGTGGEPSLLRALRAVLGQDLPLGRLFDELAARLAALGGPASVAEALAAARWSGSSAPGALAAALASGGLAFESHLALAAAMSLPPAETAALGAELAGWITGALAGAPGEGPTLSPAALLERLATEIARALGAALDPAAREAAFGRWLAAHSMPGGERAALDLTALLGAALGGIDDPRLRERLRSGLARLSLGRLGPALEALALRGLLGLGAPSRELRDAQTRRFAATAASDLKGLLLAARAAAGEGPSGAALERALQGLEAEQLLNVARRGAGEALHWSLPVPDGARSSTVHLLVDAHDSGPGGGERTWRLGLALDLSGTGPLRADLVAREGALLIAVAVERASTHAELASRADELRDALRRAGVHVALSLRRVPPCSLPAPERLADVGFLREHRLMDLSA